MRCLQIKELERLVNGKKDEKEKVSSDIWDYG